MKLPDYPAVNDWVEKVGCLEKQLAEADAMIDWLAEKLAEASGSMFDSEMEDLGFQCQHDCGQTGCTLACRKKHWRKAAQEAANA